MLEFPSHTFVLIRVNYFHAIIIDGYIASGKSDIRENKKRHKIYGFLKDTMSNTNIVTATLS